MNSAYPPNDEPTSADRPDWSGLLAVTAGLDVMPAALLARLDQQASALVDGVASIGIDLRDERALHAYMAGLAVDLPNATPRRAMTLAAAMQLIPEDVR